MVGWIVAISVRVRYFAAARELAGCSEEPIALPASESVRDFLERLGRLHPALARHLGRMRLAINEELSSGEAEVRPGDCVDVLPPVAGGSEPISASPVRLADLRTTPLSIDECFAAVRHEGAGGIAIFVGVVRNVAEGRAVDRLDYEAHETMARRELRRVLETLAGEMPNVRLAATHRVGELAIGDTAVVVAASAAHRAEAFAACRAAIDRIKETVPIWKKEWAVDGAGTWVNLEPGADDRV